jgi:hypothetical protein
MNAILEVRPDHWALLVLSRGLHDQLLISAGHMAERGPVLVLDGGNSFNAHIVARAVRGRPEALGRIRVARAFTCHQMAALLADTPPLRAPILILHLLMTFYDENVSIAERRVLLENCIERIDALSRSVQVVVSIHPPRVLAPDAEGLIARLEDAAPQLWRAIPPAPAAEQRRLF